MNEPNKFVPSKVNQNKEITKVYEKINCWYSNSFISCL